MHRCCLSQDAAPVLSQDPAPAVALRTSSPDPAAWVQAELVARLGSKCLISVSQSLSAAQPWGDGMWLSASFPER